MKLEDNLEIEIKECILKTPENNCPFDYEGKVLLLNKEVIDSGIEIVITAVNSHIYYTVMNYHNAGKDVKTYSKYYNLATKKCSTINLREKS